MTNRDTCYGSRSINLRKCKRQFWIRLTTLTALTMGLDNRCESTPRFYTTSHSDQHWTEELLVQKCKLSGWEDREKKGHSSEFSSIPATALRHIYLLQCCALLSLGCRNRTHFSVAVYTQMLAKYTVFYTVCNESVVISVLPRPQLNLPEISERSGCSPSTGPQTNKRKITSQ